MFRIYSYQVGYVFSHLCFFKDFFWHRHLYLAVDRQERKGDVTCSKGTPVGIQTGIGCVYGMRSNHSTTCACCFVFVEAAVVLCCSSTPQILHIKITFPECDRNVLVSGYDGWTKASCPQSDEQVKAFE